MDFFSQVQEWQYIAAAVAVFYLFVWIPLMIRRRREAREEPAKAARERQQIEEHFQRVRDNAKQPQKWIVLKTYYRRVCPRTGKRSRPQAAQVFIP